MPRKKEPMNEDVYQRWIVIMADNFKDFAFKSKMVGRYRVELIGGEDRGAEIYIWEKISDRLKWDPHHDFDRWVERYGDKISDDGKWYASSPASFWHYGNAYETYYYMKTHADVADIFRRMT